jgi:hypothetical protein
LLSCHYSPIWYTDTNYVFECLEIGYNRVEPNFGYLPCPLYLFGLGVCLLKDLVPVPGPVFLFPNDVLLLLLDTFAILVIY